MQILVIVACVWVLTLAENLHQWCHCESQSFLSIWFTHINTYRGRPILPNTEAWFDNVCVVAHWHFSLPKKVRPPTNICQSWMPLHQRLFPSAQRLSSRWTLKKEEQRSLVLTVEEHQLRIDVSLSQRSMWSPVKKRSSRSPAVARPPSKKSHTCLPIPHSALGIEGSVFTADTRPIVPTMHAPKQTTAVIGDQITKKQHYFSS